ncbi:MAG: glutamine synthetase type III, partial [Clostridia bacterium]|nr:glutamine synthetase type III [Clostridia bacterium]
DRNRTSPFAFTGNKFEFRMLGSNDNISCPNIMLNTMVAEELAQFADELEKAENFDEAVVEIIRRTYLEHKRIVFNGNNYAPEWVDEAAKRGLMNLRTTPAALAHYIDEKNVSLFKKHKIYSESELNARYEILLENYSKVINIEALTMIDMARKDIIPAVSKFVKELVDTAIAKKALSAEITAELEVELASKLSKLQLCFSNRIDKLDALLLKTADITDKQKLADFYADEVFPAMQEARVVADEMEMSMDANAWPYASYGQMLYSVK